MTGASTDRARFRVLRVGDAGAAGPPSGTPSRGVEVPGVEVAGVEVADSYLTRLRGMLFRSELPAGLLFVPGGSVHGVGMTRRLDVAMLVPVDDASDRVAGPFRVAKVAVLAPFGLVGSRRGVRCVLEAPVGSFARWGLVEGSVVSFEAPDPA